MKGQKQLATVQLVCNPSARPQVMAVAAALIKSLAMSSAPASPVWK